jgi:hypothetical protein
MTHPMCLKNFGMSVYSIGHTFPILCLLFSYSFTWYIFKLKKREHRIQYFTPPVKISFCVLYYCIWGMKHVWYTCYNLPSVSGPCLAKQLHLYPALYRVFCFCCSGGDFSAGERSGAAAIPRDAASQSAGLLRYSTRDGSVSLNCTLLSWSLCLCLPPPRASAHTSRTKVLFVLCVLVNI